MTKRDSAEVMRLLSSLDAVKKRILQNEMRSAERIKAGKYAWAAELDVAIENLEVEARELREDIKSIR